MPPRKDLKHIILPASIERSDFVPVTGYDPGDKDRPPLTARQQRYLHANKLKEEVTSAAAAAIKKRIDLIEKLKIPDSEIPSGVSLDIEGSTLHPLDIDALENRQGQPIEVLNVRVTDGKIYATVFVPESRLDFLKRKIQKYGEAKKDPTGTKQTTLAIDSIEAIRLADLNSFWMEDRPLPTDTTQIVVWEAWLRKGMASILRDRAEQYGIKISDHNLLFHECEICLITASLERLAIVQILAAPLVGFCHREESPGFFTELSPSDQAQWVEDLAARLQFANSDAPAVCILDTGVNNTHPLLASSLAEKDRDAYQPNWKKDDHHGHGTEMAGLALFGDLVPHLVKTHTLIVKHRLESVKILPPQGENPEELYGWITQDAISRAQVNAPHRKRVFCLAVTSAGNNPNGRPTAWSASIDKLSMGVDVNSNIDDEKKQLFMVSVGNIRDTLSPEEYPSRNDVEPIENPAQSWNALSVGAATFKTFSDDKTLDGWQLLAQKGKISPISRTSNKWEEKDEWPIKPDVVFEGGNRITDGKFVSDHPDLSVLTTGRKTPFQFCRDTSAATAEIARMGAILQTEYPDLWPETIRGLIVHSASWDDVMLDGKKIKNLIAIEKENILRRYGYGIPNLEVARFSASNRACLISQYYIQPFLREGDKQATYREMNLHKLPWPEIYLKENGTTKIRLRVTLSYYIEPSPSKRIPTQKYGYASHQLRFALQRPLETIGTFKKRINKKYRTPGEEFSSPGSDNWFIGPNTRNKGSLVSDIWEGTAAELADQAAIAVMPGGGWWKARKHLNRTNQKTRYSLIITLETENQELDIYTQIHNQIKVLSEITI